MVDKKRCRDERGIFSGMHPATREVILTLVIKDQSITASTEPLEISVL